MPRGCGRNGNKEEKGREDDETTELLYEFENLNSGVTLFRLCLSWVPAVYKT
jgi:hypothetical protein